MSQYGETVKRMKAASAAEEPPKEGPCIECGKVTKNETLSNYGARCFKCYEAYLAAMPKVDTADKRSEGPKAWAMRLKRLEATGVRLSSVQKTMWRAALREPTHDQD